LSFRSDLGTIKEVAIHSQGVDTEKSILMEKVRCRQFGFFDLTHIKHQIMMIGNEGLAEMVFIEKANRSLYLSS
jgi:hypothetical protein